MCSYTQPVDTDVTMLPFIACKILHVQFILQKMSTDWFGYAKLNVLGPVPSSRVKLTRRLTFELTLC